MKLVNDMYQNRDVLAREILDHMYPNEPFTEQEREEKALEDIKWTLLFLIEGIKVSNVVIMNELFTWFKRLFKGLNIPLHHADKLYESTKHVLDVKYKSTELNKFIDSISINEIEEQVYYIHENPYNNAKEKYLNALLTSNRSEAIKVVMDLVNNDVPIQDIYIHIFQHSMYEIGKLWQDGVINVGREHYSTAMTQYVMSTLYPYIFNVDKKKAKRMIASAVGSELHEMGIRMVADLFEMNGWSTDYLGANLPSSQLIKFAKEKSPHVIALSITMPYHISTLKETIEKIRQDEDLKDVKILVGGRPFHYNLELVDALDADGYAPNAIEGIKVANQLFE